MPEKTLTQAEADALIAGAYLAAANTMWRVICSKNSPPPHGTNAAKEAILLLTPDAARLALEEREKEARHEWGMPYAAIESYCAEREDKLIADTRLDELKQVGEVYQSFDYRNEFISWLNARLAAHRAAVQGGASRDDS